MKRVPVVFAAVILLVSLTTTACKSSPQLISMSANISSQQPIVMTANNSSLPPDTAPDGKSPASPLGTTPSYTILSGGGLSKNALAAFLLENNPAVDRNWVSSIIDLYISEANAEGVNYEIAFAQMCYHTNYLSFNGTFANAASNNFFGLTSVSNPETAHVFASYQTGIRAHIQHLKGYATREPLRNACVDPRYSLIEEEHGWGSSPTINGLSNRWAGADYADKIKSVLSRLYGA